MAVPKWLANVAEIASAASPIAELASPLVGLFGSLLGGSQQEKNVRETNATNLQIARENNSAQERMLFYNNAFNKQAAIDMFNLENEYNSPANQRALMLQGGFNPATMYQNGAQVARSDASTPQAASSGITPTMPNLTPPPSSIGAMFGNFESFTRALTNISNSSLADAQKNRLSLLMGAEFDKLVADTKSVELQNAWNDFKFGLDKIYLKEKQFQEIQKLMGDVFNAYAQGGAATALEALHRMETRLTDSKFKMNEEQRPILLENLKKIGNVYDSEVALNKSHKVLNDASADKTRAESTSIKILNKILPEKYANEITVSQVEAIERILNAGSAHNMAELVNQLVNSGIRREAAEEIVKRRNEIIDELKDVK